MNTKYKSVNLNRSEHEEITEKQILTLPEIVIYYNHLNKPIYLYLLNYNPRKSLDVDTLKTYLILEFYSLENDKKVTFTAETFTEYLLNSVAEFEIIPPCEYTKQDRRNADRVRRQYCKYATI